MCVLAKVSTNQGWKQKGPKCYQIKMKLKPFCIHTCISKYTSMDER